MSDPDRKTLQTQSLTRYLGAGAELAGGVLLFTLIGYWIDVTFDTRPWATVILACLGIVGGLYNLIRGSVHDILRSSQRTGQKSAERSDHKVDRQ